MNLQEMLLQPTFPRLQPGIHQVVVLSWKVKTSSTGEDFVSIEFAPSSETRNVQHTALYSSDKVDTLQTFCNNIQDILNLPGASKLELLNACIGLEIPATYELNIKPDKTYYNWHLGWAKPAQPTPVAQPTVGEAPARRARA